MDRVWEKLGIEMKVEEVMEIKEVKESRGGMLINGGQLLAVERRGDRFHIEGEKNKIENKAMCYESEGERKRVKMGQRGIWIEGKCWEWDEEREGIERV